MAEVDGGGQRKNEGKAPVDMLSGRADIAVSRVLEMGAKKYAPHNWRRGMKWSYPLACIGRHLAKIRDGEWFDEESGQPHVAHIACNAAMLLDYVETYPEGNDLYQAPGTAWPDAPSAPAEPRHAKEVVEQNPMRCPGCLHALPPDDPSHHDPNCLVHHFIPRQRDTPPMSGALFAHRVCTCPRDQQVPGELCRKCNPPILFPEEQDGDYDTEKRQ